MNYNKVIPIDFDYSSSHIIKPPEVKKDKDIKYTRTVISSRDRDIDRYPNPNNYVVDLQTEIDEVVAGEILLLDVPFSSYLINSNNDTIIVNDENLKIPHGNYSKDEFAKVLENTFNTTSDIYTIQYVKAQDNFEIVSNMSEYTVKATSYLAQIIGFKENKLYSSTNRLLRSEYRCRFDVNKYIILTVDYMTINNSIDSNVHKSTAIVYENELQINTKALTIPIKKYFNPIVPRLRHVRIKLTDYYGNPYDFQNHDHRIDIMYESRKHSIKYMS
jgi:hypothetical protein